MVHFYTCFLFAIVCYFVLSWVSIVGFWLYWLVARNFRLSFYRRYCPCWHYSSSGSANRCFFIQNLITKEIVSSHLFFCEPNGSVSDWYETWNSKCAIACKRQQSWCARCWTRSVNETEEINLLMAELNKSTGELITCINSVFPVVTQQEWNFSVLEPLSRGNPRIWPLIRIDPR